MQDPTTVKVSDPTWERLDDRKDRGETFNDVISELLDIARAVEESDDLPDDVQREV